MSVNTKFDTQKNPFVPKTPNKIKPDRFGYIGDDITQLCGDYPLYPPEV